MFRNPGLCDEVCSASRQGEAGSAVVPPTHAMARGVHENSAPVPEQVIQPSEMAPQFFPWAAHVVRVHVVPAVIVSGAVTVPASCAVIVAVVVVCTADVPAAKVAVVWP